MSLVTVKGLKLLIAEKTEMPDRKQNDKGDWEKTGSVTEKTTYTFKDTLTSEKLVFIGGNEWRALEGKEVDIQVDIKYNDYQRKTSVSLKNVSAI